MPQRPTVRPLGCHGSAVGRAGLAGVVSQTSVKASQAGARRSCWPWSHYPTTSLKPLCAHRQPRHLRSSRAHEEATSTRLIGLAEKRAVRPPLVAGRRRRRGAGATRCQRRSHRVRPANRIARPAADLLSHRRHPQGGLHLRLANTFLRLPVRTPAHTCTNPTLLRASHALTCGFLGSLLAARAQGAHRVVAAAAAPLLALAGHRYG